MRIPAHGFLRQPGCIPVKAMRQLILFSVLCETLIRLQVLCGTVWDALATNSKHKLRSL